MESMDAKMILELVGYLGSGLVIISMLMTSVVRLRVINMIGSGIFTIYALLIHSYPTALMNLFLVGINLFYLIRMQNRAKTYELLKTVSCDEFLTYFLTFYQEDILKYFPGFRQADAADCTAFVICCEQMPAGILLGKVHDREMEMLLYYSTPSYRDFSIGEFLYSTLPKYGIQRLVIRDPGQHGVILQKMGFKEQEGTGFVKEL